MFTTKDQNNEPTLKYIGTFIKYCLLSIFISFVSLGVPLVFAFLINIEKENPVDMLIDSGVLFLTNCTITIGLVIEIWGFIRRTKEYVSIDPNLNRQKGKFVDNYNNLIVFLLLSVTSNVTLIPAMSYFKKIELWGLSQLLLVLCTLVLLIMTREYIWEQERDFIATIKN